MKKKMRKSFLTRMIRLKMYLMIMEISMITKKRRKVANQDTAGNSRKRIPSAFLKRKPKIQRNTRKRKKNPTKNKTDEKRDPRELV